jgi:hypothetical protein
LFTPSKELARFQKFLPKSMDLTLIVLKGHLLVEEQINEFLSSLLPHPNALKIDNLHFPTRLCLIRAHIGENSCTDVFNAVQELNTLRNKMAHHLEPPEIENLLNSFLRKFEDPDIPLAEYEREPKARRLKRCIGFICGQLCGIREASVFFKDTQRNDLQ